MQRTVSFARRGSDPKLYNILPCSAHGSDDTPEFDYEKEVILLFYNSMLNLIVDEWKVITNEDLNADDNTESKEVEMKDFKDLTQEDMTDIQVLEATGSRISYTTKRRKSVKSRSSKIDASQVSASQNIIRTVRSVSRADSILPPDNELTRTMSAAPTTPAPSMEADTNNTKYTQQDWFVSAGRERVSLKFKNGNTFCGFVEGKRFDGDGTFVWSDGTTYEGEFKEGEIIGNGRLFYKDTSTYLGGFNRGVLHGNGTIFIACSNILYSGNWKKGKQNGKGWILYQPQNWYDGEWLDGMRHGEGLRQYDNSSRYQGDWVNGNQHGQGIMVWNNHDFYNGEWKDGTMDGYGEYVWRGFFHRELIFPLMNTYEGQWMNGMRTGMGVLRFGFNGGARMAGEWIRNMKHGAGLIVCGNGKVIRGNLLFMYDKPIDTQLFTNNTCLTTVNKLALARSSVSERHSRNEALNVPSIPPDKCCPKSEQDLDRLHMFSEIPITYSSQVNPLRIPVHSEPRSVDLIHYLQKVCLKYGLEYSPLTHKSSKEISYEKELQANILQFEEKKLRLSITYNYLLMQAAYQRYATICSRDKLNFRPVLVRLFLWQFYLDVGVTKTMSLIDTDLCLLENPDCGLESEHNPFEKINFWQFIYSILSVAWALYSSDCDEYKPNGILATILTKFVRENMSPNLGKVKGTALYEYVNLLPINSMYLFYRSIGEPHTVRIFIRTCLSKFQNMCEGILKENKVDHIKKGINMVIGKIMYIPSDIGVGKKPTEPTPYPFKEHIYESLRIFTKLKPMQLIKHIARQCPLVMEDDLIVNMDYMLSFLEFYNILLAVTIKILDNTKKAEQREKEKLCASSSRVSKLNRRQSSPHPKKFKK